MASLRPALSGVQLGRSQGREWLYGLGLDSSDGSQSLVWHLGHDHWPEHLHGASPRGLASS